MVELTACVAGFMKFLSRGTIVGVAYCSLARMRFFSHSIV